MSNYIITLFNKQKKEQKIKNIVALTFAEAARSAFLMRVHDNHGWEIESIIKSKPEEKR